MFIRRFHHQRIPNYKGWWTLILETPQQKHIQPEVRTERVPVAIPTVSIIDPVTTTHVEEKPKTVYLQGVQVEIPKKPPPPDNCCMSGCAHCVWDMYQEDIEDYRERKNDLIKRFEDAGEAIPKELQKQDNSDPLEDMDPTMKAFLAMEKKLNG